MKIIKTIYDLEQIPDHIIKMCYDSCKKFPISNTIDELLNPTGICYSEFEKSLEKYGYKVDSLSVLASICMRENNIKAATSGFLFN